MAEFLKCSARDPKVQGQIKRWKKIKNIIIWKAELFVPS